MSSSKAKAFTSIFKKGNPWLVGHNYGRVAPVFFLNALLSDKAAVGASERVGRILNLLRDEAPSGIEDMPIDIEQAEGISIAIRGALAADRRAFRTSSGSALFPVSSRLIMSTGSDDGLGGLTRDLLYASEFRSDYEGQLSRVLTDCGPSPSQVEDPISRFGQLLAGPVPHSAQPSGSEADALNLEFEFDGHLAGFIVNAFRFGPRTQRLSALRSLAHAGYLVSILRMLQAPIIAETGYSRMVLVYAGLPPGSANEPTSAAAIASFRSVVRVNWESTVQLASRQLSDMTAGTGGSETEALRKSIRATIGPTLSREIGLEEMFAARSAPHTLTTLRQFVLEGLGGGVEVLSQRIRGLATKIGFATPDRGAGGIRFALDTPLLAVLVNGLVPGSTLSFEQFVTRLRTELGLVLGIGEDDSFVEQLETETYGSHGRSIYDVLMENEQVLRQRLIRTGLARTYSDAHTEVISSDA